MECSSRWQLQDIRLLYGTADVDEACPEEGGNLGKLAMNPESETWYRTYRERIVG